MAQQKRKARQVVGKRRTRQHVQERGNTRRKNMLDAAEELLGSVPIEELSFKLISEKRECLKVPHIISSPIGTTCSVRSLRTSRFASARGTRTRYRKKNVTSWHDVVNIIVDRAVRIYRESPAAMQIWLSGRTPAEVRLADHVSDKKVSSDIRSVFERFFVLPDLPAEYDIFFHFLELADVLLSLSIIENGKLTDQMIEEAKRAGRGYLGTYLPPVLERVN